MRKQALARRDTSTALVSATRGPRAWRLGIVRDLLADLHTSSAAGQRFTIEKVVKILEDEAASAAARLPELQRRGLAKGLADLRVERTRPSPQVDAFVHRTEALLWILATA